MQQAFESTVQVKDNENNALEKMNGELREQLEKQDVELKKYSEEIIPKYQSQEVEFHKAKDELKLNLALT